MAGRKFNTRHLDFASFRIVSSENDGFYSNSAETAIIDAHQNCLNLLLPGIKLLFGILGFLTASLGMWFVSIIPAIDPEPGRHDYQLPALPPKSADHIAQQHEPRKTVVDLYCQCKNKECAATFVMTLAFKHYLNPPVKWTAQLAQNLLNHLSQEERAALLQATRLTNERCRQNAFGL